VGKAKLEDDLADPLRYAHLPRLGGLRRAREASPNAGWRNASFRLGQCTADGDAKKNGVVF
jgi:hypothetical protein